MDQQDELAVSLLENLAGKGLPTDATIQSPQRLEEIAANGALKNLVRKGWLTPPIMSSQDPPPRAAVAPFRELMEELDRDREER